MDLSTVLVGTPARRWAGYVLALTDAPSDARTLADWGRAVGVSRTMLVESCARLRIAPRDARDLARVLRLIRRPDLSWDPRAYLDIADQRTFRDLLQRANLSDYRPGARPSPRRFLEKQRFVEQTNPGFAALWQMIDE